MLSQLYDALYFDKIYFILLKVKPTVYFLIHCCIVSCIYLNTSSVLILVVINYYYYFH